MVRGMICEKNYKQCLWWDKGFQTHMVCGSSSAYSRGVCHSRQVTVRKCVGPCCIHCNCEGSNPVLDLERTPRLFLPYNSYITNDPSIDHTVVATARVGHWLGRGWAGHWIGDVTIHSFDRPVRARNDRARPHSHVTRLYDPCTNCGRGHDRHDRLPWIGEDCYEWDGLRATSGFYSGRRVLWLADSQITPP